MQTYTSRYTLWFVFFWISSMYEAPMCNVSQDMSADKKILVCFGERKKTIKIPGADIKSDEESLCTNAYKVFLDLLSPTIPIVFQLKDEKSGANSWIYYLRPPQNTLGRPLSELVSLYHAQCNTSLHNPQLQHISDSVHVSLVQDYSLHEYIIARSAYCFTAHTSPCVTCGRMLQVANTVSVEGYCLLP